MSLNLTRALAALLLIAAFPAFAGKYTPEIWPLADGLIPAFDMAGKIEVVNAQPSTDEAPHSNYGGSADASYNAITQVMVNQVRGEIAKNGRPLDGPDKTIEIKVTHLLTKYKIFHWKSSMRFEAKLGNGAVFSKEVFHASALALQDLNGCIAEGVMVLLNEPKVREYLSQPGDAAPQAHTVGQPSSEAEPVKPTEPAGKR